MPNSVNPQSNSLHFQSHTQLTTLSCTTHNISMPHYSPSFLSSSQFESCGSDRTSCRPSPLSLLSGISTATLYHYIHTYYILYIISGRLTLQPPPKEITDSFNLVKKICRRFVNKLIAAFFISNYSCTRIMV